MAISGVQSARPGEDVVISVRVDGIRRRMRMHTRDLDGLTRKQVRYRMRQRAEAVPEDVFFNRESDGSVSVATGVEPDWAEMRLANG